MFIKVNESLVINTDRIAFIDIGDNVAQLYERFNREDFIQIPRDVALYLLSLIDSNTALAALSADPPSLTSRVAQALRDNYPNGASAHELAQATDADTTATYEALESLQEERVAVNVGDAALWFHVTNAPRPATPEALPLADFNARETLYHWDCIRHVPPHLNSTIVSGKDFQAGILYCDLCGSSHVVDDKVLALYGAPVIAADVPVVDLRPSHWVCTDSNCPYNKVAPDHRLAVCQQALKSTPYPLP